MSKIDEVKLVDGKKKNGHKSSCSCHNCENMKNKAKRGGYEDELKIEEEKLMGGSKKKNGHRRDCKCPICKNMKNSKKRGGSKSSKVTRKRIGGDDEEYNEEEIEIKNEDTDSDSDSDSSDEEIEEVIQEAGRKKRSNGHKTACRSPICKNMRKGKKGGYEQPDEENQIGDIEEGGIKAITGSDLGSSQETTASLEDYDELVMDKFSCVEFRFVGGIWYILSSDGLKQS